MARIGKGILGGFQGKVGNVIGASWRSIDYMRSLPRRIKRKPSERQLIQQRKFRVGLDFMRLLKRAFDLGHAGVRYSRSSVYSESFGHVLIDAIIGTYPNFKIDYSKVEISRGPILGLNDLDWIKTAAGKIKFSWTNDRNLFNSDENDQVLVLLMDKERDILLLYSSMMRKSLLLEIDLIKGSAPNNLIAWVFMYNSTEKVCSNSAFLSGIKDEVKP